MESLRALQKGAHILFFLSSFSFLLQETPLSSHHFPDNHRFSNNHTRTTSSKTSNNVVRQSYLRCRRLRVGQREQRFYWLAVHPQEPPWGYPRREEHPRSSGQRVHLPIHPHQVSTHPKNTLTEPNRSGLADIFVRLRSTAPSILNLPGTSDTTSPTWSSTTRISGSLPCSM